METLLPYLTTLAADPAVWAALATLVAMEVVLGIDNLIFISILTNKLPDHQRQRARHWGIGLALVLRLALLGTVSWIVGLTQPVFTILEKALSWRDLILLAGGLFLVWKATREIHHHLEPAEARPAGAKTSGSVTTFGAITAQILVLDLVFSVDSIITAVGMTDDIPVMVIAVIAAVSAMLLAANPLANFVQRNPSVLMLALGFLLLIGTTLIAEGLGVHLPKGYIYAAMGFAGLVEGLNLLARRARS